MDTIKKTSINLRKADAEATPRTFDLAKVKSTVTNPSQMFNGISVDDEQKILKYVSDNYSNGSTFEKQQAVQGLYNAALNKQKQADIDAGRQEIKLQLINKANNANIGKEKNEYLSQLKKADLADLIKDQLIKQGYKNSDFMNITDDGIIMGFIETNPQYKDAFNKFFYDNEGYGIKNGQWQWGTAYNQNDIVQLGKDLGWIEKDRGDKIKDKAEGIVEGMKGWLPYWGEGVKDWSDLTLAGSDQSRTREQNLNDVSFYNYVQDKYGTYPGALTDKDLKQAKADFENQNKAEYTPTYEGAYAKMAMGLTDIGFTAGGLKGANLLRNNMFKLGFSTLANDDNMSRAPELLGEGLEFVGSNVNKIPGFSEIRDGLQTEQEKADWDAFVGGNVLALFRGAKRGVKNVKDLDINVLKESFDKAREGNVEGGINKAIKDARETKYHDAKVKKAQQITQGEIETRETTAKGLDTLYEEGKLKDVKNVDDLQKGTQEVIDKLKQQQTDIAASENKRFGNNELGLSSDVEVLDNNGNRTTQKVMSYPINKLLDNIIEHYEKTDPKEATKYKSYRKALENGSLPADALLEIKREGNSLNQSVYNNKTNLIKDTDKAEAWAKNMSEVNQVFEGLDVGENIRNIDSKLSSLYTVKNGIDNIKKAEANFNKKAIEGSGLAKKVGGFISRALGKLSFGTTNFLSKAFVSMLQESIGGMGFEKTQYNAAEIANKVPEFVKEYTTLLDKIENGTNLPKNRMSKMINAFIDKRELGAMYKEPEED